MNFNPEIHHRHSIRLKGYDYSQSGLYFITICTQNREHIFGIIKNGDILLNEYGNIVKNEWKRTPEIRKEIKLHEYIVMPDHIHGIVEITDGRGDVNCCGGDVYCRRGDVYCRRGDVYCRRGDRPVAPTTTLNAPTTTLNAPIKTLNAPIKTLIVPRIKPGPKQKSIGAMVAGYKSSVTKQINILRGKPGVPIWQRNYYEHIIRNEESYYKISEYIKSNPKNWQDDNYNQ